MDLTFTLAGFTHTHIPMTSEHI